MRRSAKHSKDMEKWGVSRGFASAGNVRSVAIRTCPRTRTPPSKESAFRVTYVREPGARNIVQRVRDAA